MPPPPHITDYLRILMGDLPWSFLLEAIIRVLVLYLLLLTGLRLMGKRMAGQFSRSDLAALVSLAVAIGIPILSADRGVLGALVVAVVVVLGQRAVSHWSARSPRVEHLLQGTVTTVVSDGVLELAHMAQSVVSKERLFSQLRSDNLEHLGQVHRLYMEANGTFSLVQADEPQPGLSIIPDWDSEFRQIQAVVPGKFACRQCGHVADTAQAPTTACPRCQTNRWEPAVMIST